MLGWLLLGFVQSREVQFSVVRFGAARWSTVECRAPSWNPAV